MATFVRSKSARLEWNINPHTEYGYRQALSLGDSLRAGGFADDDQRRYFAAGYESRMQPSQETHAIIEALGTSVAAVAVMIPKTASLLSAFVALASDQDFLEARIQSRTLGAIMLQMRDQHVTSPTPLAHLFNDLARLVENPTNSAFGLIIALALVMLLRLTPKGPATLGTFEAILSHAETQPMAVLANAGRMKGLSPQRIIAETSLETAGGGIMPQEEDGDE
ncbi:MAG TPA: hypothetical protein VGG89_14245 [Candidatus Baltobacteraceae bacterium]|jgi:hypothetical protein